MILFAADYVGYKITEYMCSRNEPLKAFVYDAEDRGGYNDAMMGLLHKTGRDIKIFEYASLKDKQIQSEIASMEISLGILAWWPYIINQNIISMAKNGFINTHPSYLPYNRGKHPYFWSIVDDTKFGVTLHYVTANIDDGAIIAQREIPIAWTDTGESLYEKSREEMVKLFADNLDLIKTGHTVPIQQDKNAGSFHYGKELEPFCQIKLNEQYYAKDLLNILRGRMFRGKGEAYFYDESQRYKVSLKIEKG